MSAEESISLEETNKIRISLGLKPLTDDKAPADDKEKQAEDNYAKQRERERKEKETKQIVDRIAKVRNRRELNASLKGATLGDADAETDDTLKWIKRNRKKQKELAKKRQEELESMDKMFQEEYTERDLAGLKVSHDIGDLEDGEARILTLKDSRILDDEEDELQNVEMAEADKEKKVKEDKLKNRAYTGYDDDEFMEGQAGIRRGVLSKYDEDINGPSETGFRLGNNSAAKKSLQASVEQQLEGVTVNKALLTIDYIKNVEKSDYLKEGDVGFKKPKTKKKRPSRRVPAEAELAGNDMEVDDRPIAPIVRDLDANFVDDDDLQAALARTRNEKLRKAKKLSPEDLARKITEERAQAEADALNAMKVEEIASGEEGGLLTLDDTTEFIRSVGNNPVELKKEPVHPKVEDKDPPHSRDASMAPGDVKLEEMDMQVAVKEEDVEDDDVAMLDAIEEAWKQEDAAATDDAEKHDEDIGGTASEQTHKSGMAATLNILRQQGILAGASLEGWEREQVQKDRDRWLADQRQRVAQRELAKVQARGQNKDQATREYENRVREQQEARENMEAFKDYKPDVNIVYYDEFGRTLTVKEAWKALSHKFHGKGSGKMKTEKRLKKIAEEKKQAAMVSGDTPLSMNDAFQRRQQKTGQAHFVLSVGNRGAVPQATDFLEPQPLSKGKTEKTKKKREGKGKGAAEDNGDFITLPAPQLHLMDAAGPSIGSASGSPAPRAGFSRIGSVAVDTPSPGATPGSNERSKVAFGFGTKRKATDEGAGTPPSKRR